VEELLYIQTGQRLQYNTEHAHCMLDNQGYKHRVCNTYCFSMTKMVMRTRLNITIILTLPFLLVSFLLPVVEQAYCLTHAWSRFC